MLEAIEHVSKIDKKFIAMIAAQMAFICQRCGRCCQGTMAVMIRQEECRNVATSLGISLKNFIKLYTERNRRSEEGFLLRGTSEQKSCPFYDETAGCRIHKVRPTVCRVYPCMNAEEGQIEPHFYKTCPGCYELVEEIYATQLAPEINPVVEEFKKSPEHISLMEAIIWSEGMELFEHSDKIMREKISDIRENLKFRRMSEDRREDFRQILIAYLSLVAPQETLKEYLKVKSKIGN